MKHHLARICLLFLLLGTPLLLSGCGVLLLGGAAAGTVGYVSGDLNATLGNRFADVVRATEQVVADNAITLLAKDNTSYSTSFSLKTSQGDKVKLDVVYATRDITNITIRWGVFGDEALSTRFLNEIKNRLK